MFKMRFCWLWVQMQPSSHCVSIVISPFSCNDLVWRFTSQHNELRLCLLLTQTEYDFNITKINFVGLIYYNFIRQFMIFFFLFNSYLIHLKIIFLWYLPSIQTPFLNNQNIRFWCQIFFSQIFCNLQIFILYLPNKLFPRFSYELDFRYSKELISQGKYFPLLFISFWPLKW